MRLYWEFTVRSYRRFLTYRAATYAGLITNYAFGILQVAIFLALLGERESIGGYDAAGIVTYAGMMQAIIAFLSIFGWAELMNSVYTGEVGADLLRPVDFFTMWFARDLGRAWVQLLLRGVLFMALFEIPFDLVYPTNWWQWVLLPYAMLMGLVISFSYRFLVNLAAFWTPQARGISRFGYALGWFLSGFLMPLRLLPEWIQDIAALTPFPYMLSMIIELYVGILTGQELLIALGMQLIWMIALIIICRLVLRAGVRRLVILGG